MRTSRFGRARPVVAAALFALLIPAGAHAAAGDIRTIAGGGVGDGGPALSANLPGPSGIAIDAHGNLFIADRIGNRIREVAPDGTIRTLAGTGAVGFFGDTGPAIRASLNAPASLALDDAGNIFVADSGNHRVREIRTDGTIVTVAGTGVKGYFGDGGAATSAQLNDPSGVYVDSHGALFIADTYNNRIRKVVNGIITTAAGNGSAGYYGDEMDASQASLGLPTGMIFDKLGNMFIADQLNHRIRRVDTQNKVSTYAGSLPGGNLAGLQVPLGDGLPAQIARLYFPTSIVLDAAGDLFIADVWDHRIRKVDPAGFMSTVAGTGAKGFAGDGGAATAALLNFPEGVAIGPAGELYFSDTDNHRVRKIDVTGRVTTVAGDGSSAYYGDGGPATGANLYYPAGIASGSDGSIFIADSWNQRVRVIAPDGTIDAFAGSGENGFTGDGGPASAATFNYPNDVALDAAGNLYVADTLNNRIRMITPEGLISTVAGTDGSGYNGDDQLATDAWLRQPFGVAVDAAGNLFIADTGNNRIREVTTDGQIHTVAGRSGGPGFNGDEILGTDAMLSKPYDVAVDNAGNVFVADSGNARVRIVTPDGIIHAYAGDGKAGSSPDGGPAKAAHLSRPYSLLFNGSALYIADAGSEKIQRVDSGGFIHRIAGGGFGFGDGGPALSAGLHGPSGLAIAPDGTLILSDTLAHRVRAITAPF